MTEFISHSQAGQDKFVYDTLVKPTNYINGTFLDIGCGFPIEINNTYSLEQLGWRGVLIDKDPGFVESCRQQRQSPVIEADATTMIWANDSALRDAPPTRAPSILGFSIRDFVLYGLTLPP